MTKFIVFYTLFENKNTSTNAYVKTEAEFIYFMRNV